jgi:hypothetical protein
MDALQKHPHLNIPSYTSHSTKGDPTQHETHIQQFAESSSSNQLRPPLTTPEGRESVPPSLALLIYVTTDQTNNFSTLVQLLLPSPEWPLVELSNVAGVAHG